jgi:hypothetical protein
MTFDRVHSEVDRSVALDWVIIVKQLGLESTMCAIVRLAANSDVRPLRFR